jgi:hypothetical protein
VLTSGQTLRAELGTEGEGRSSSRRNSRRNSGDVAWPFGGEKKGKILGVFAGRCCICLHISQSAAIPLLARFIICIL